MSKKPPPEKPSGRVRKDTSKDKPRTPRHVHSFTSYIEKDPATGKSTVYYACSGCGERR